MNTKKSAQPADKQPKSQRFRWWYILAGLSATIGTALVLIFVSSIAYKINNHTPTTWGASFSVKQAQFLGVDWQQNYTALLDDMQLKHLRLMSYWDEGEPQSGQYTFTDLDWQFAQANKRGAKISLAIGLRQPRWPECHQPEWAKQLDDRQQYDALRQYITEVVTRYHDNPALQSYQLENEALLHAFGECPQRSRDDLDGELKLVKSLDHNTPVYMSISDQYGLPFGKPRPDGYGFSLYRRNWFAEGGFYFRYPFLPSWYGGRAQLINWYSGKPVFIHELQLEPWGPRPISELSRAEQDKSMSRQQVVNVLNFARQTDIPTAYAWGSEWWYWRMTVHNDPSIWDTVKAEMQKDQEHQGGRQ